MTVFGLFHGLKSDKSNPFQLRGKIETIENCSRKERNYLTIMNLSVGWFYSG